MKKAALGCLVVVAILGVIVIAGGVMAAYGYNRLVNLSQTVDGQWAQVENVYQRRADLIPQLVATVSGAANFEKSTLTAVITARASVGQVKIDPSKAPNDPQLLAQYQQAQGQLGTALSRLLVVAEAYPNLTATAGFRDLQAQIEGSENRITVERGRFNAVATTYNIAVREFPTMLYARAMGFAPKPFFAAAVGADQAPVVKFDFNPPTAPAPPAPVPTH